MCTVVVLFRPGHDWPLLLAANRDEMAGRPWDPPARHWADRPEVRGGRDRLAGGTWLAMNDDKVVAAVLNRSGSLGPAPGYRSRGELPLEAVDHAEAAVAAEALADLEPSSYRPFNMVIGDVQQAFWLRGDGRSVRAEALPEGYSMVTAHDRNDRQSKRIARYLPLFETAPVPDPAAGDWTAWAALLADPGPAGGGPEGALCVQTPGGFGTVSSSLIALPADAEKKPVWRFAPGRPDRADYADI